MFIIDKVVQEDHRMLLANELESITLQDTTTQVLCPASHVAVFEDFCLLGSTGERPQLQLEYLLKTFALELIEERPTTTSSSYSEPLPILQHHLFPPLALQNALRVLRFPLTLRGTCVFLLLKRFSSEFETEAEVILTLLLELIHDETDASER
ncbi:hypothetical protein BGY98DRAFT_1101369 [Russula aff. rugulosa BPL654]|nr:hypothetical protein BGY98DRAFT_1101369 [Russula aff. rugulosa BPL654]